MFSKIASVFVAGLALVNAYTQPVGNPSGNAIVLPGLNQVVPAGAPFTVTWDPSTTGTVTILLLKGPSTNVVPLYPIASSIENSGTFSWTPALDLQPTGDSGYGLQLIVDATGQFQYSTQFGISNPNYSASSGNSTTGMSMPTGGSNSTMTVSNSTMTTSSSAVSSTAVSNITMTTMSAAATTTSVQVQQPTTTGSSGSSSGAGAVVASLGSAFIAFMVAAAVL